MKLIVAVDRNWAIGRKNSLLVSIPSDMKFFRETTMHKVIVMGRKTLESFPGGRALPGRTNIVLSNRPDYEAGSATVVHSPEELLEVLKEYDPEDVYVIGGGSIYRQLLPYCDTAFVTKIDHAYEADTYFPNLDEHPDWELTGISEEQTYFDLEYRFLKYERKA